MDHMHAHRVRHCRTHRLPPALDVGRYAPVTGTDWDEDDRAIGFLTRWLVHAITIEPDSVSAHHVELREYPAFAERVGYDPEIAAYLEVHPLSRVVVVTGRARPPFPSAQYDGRLLTD